MTKIIYLTLMLVISSVINSFGQQSKSLNSSLEGGASDAYVVKNKYYNANLIKQTTLLVVLDKDTTTSLSKLIIKAIKDNWTFSKYSFISESGLSSYEGKEGYCIFDVYTKILKGEGIVKSKDYIEGCSYIIRSAMNNKANTDFIAEFKLPCFRDKDNKLTLLNYEYLLPVIVRTFQDEQDYNYKTDGKVPKDYKERIHGTVGGHATYYNEGKIKMLKMKIYVCKEGIKCENKTKPCKRSES